MFLDREDLARDTDDNRGTSFDLSNGIHEENLLRNQRLKGSKHRILLLSRI